MFTEVKEYYSVFEVSRIFGVNYNTVIKMIKDGRLTAEKPGKSYKISFESMKKLVEEGRKKL